MKTDVLKILGKIIPTAIFVLLLPFSIIYKQSLLFHPKILSPIKRTGNKNAACRYLVRVCFSLYIL